MNTAPNNPATVRAGEIMNKFRKDREEKFEHEKFMSRFPDFLKCVDCARGENLTKYPKDEMSHTPHQVIRKGMKTIIYVHRCKEHAKTYRPQRLRAGHVNGL